MIKVIHIITRMDMGGSAQNTLFTCLGLNNEKYEILLVHGLSLESEMTEPEKKLVETKFEEAKEIAVRIIPLPSLVRGIDPAKDFMAFFTLLKLMFLEKPAIVHTHSSKAGILGRLAAWIAGVPHIVHTPHGHVFYGHFGPVTSRVFFLIEKVISKITHRIIALTEGEKQDYINFGLIGSNKLVTIHSGVEIKHYAEMTVNVEEKRRTLGLNPGGFIVGTVGWLLPTKGPVILLRAMGRICKDRTDVELVYVGKGELEASLRAESLQMGISDKVKFLGWREDVPEIMPIFDVFVLPSLNEGMGRVLVEAMATERPLVASNVGGIPDLVSPEENGLLVSPGDDHALAESIMLLLQNPEKAKRMGEKGKELCSRFSVQSMVENIDTLYAELLT